MRTLTRFCLSFLLTCLAVVGVSAQTLSTTTLNATAASTDTTLTVVSSAAMAPGYLALIDREVLTIVTVPSSTSITVQRQKGGILGSHTSGENVYSGPASFFFNQDPPSSACSASGGLTYYVNMTTGTLFTCPIGYWAQHFKPVSSVYTTGTYTNVIADKIILNKASQDISISRPSSKTISFDTDGLGGSLTSFKVFATTFVISGTAQSTAVSTTGFLATSQVTPPTCSGSCGTSPSVVGGDIAMLVTMGSSGSPASPFTVTFNGTWAAAPSCQAVAAKTGMAAGKAPILVVSSTTTVVVTTNGTAPGTSDVYSIQCIGVQ